jgi:hypothetical protein
MVSNFGSFFCFTSRFRLCCATQCVMFFRCSMVMQNEKKSRKKTGEQTDDPNIWEDLCRKRLSYPEYERWQQNRDTSDVPRSVLRFFVMFEDAISAMNLRVDDSATPRICFDWYIFIGCVCAGLITPLHPDRVYVVDLS